jgi:Protein of unknown function (DUF3551)
MAATNKSFHGQRLLALKFAVAVLAGAGALTLSDAAHAGSRQIAPWCAYMGGGYGFDCSYFTFQQCMDTARGLGNYCQPNPRAQLVQQPVRRKVRKYRY